MLLMIDNYDSFTYNIVQYFGELGQDVRTVRNDEITIEAIEQLNPERICLSPGPCTPRKPAFAYRCWSTLRGAFPSWACAWGIRPSAMRSVAA